VQESGNMLGVSAEDRSTQVSRLEKAKEADKKVSAIKMLPMRAFLEDQINLYSDRGIRQGMFYIEDNVLREIDRKDPIVSIISNNRCKQAKRFAQPSKDDNEPGYRIKLKDSDRSPTKEEQNEAREIEQWFYKTGRVDFEGSEKREDSIVDVISMMAREYMTIDKVCVEIRRDIKGDVVDFWLVDGATIKRVYSGGFRGSKNDFDPRSCIFGNTEFERKLAAMRTEMIPDDMRKIAFVQEISGRLVAAFSRRDLIFDTNQKRVDIRYKGFPYSPAEPAMNVITAFLYSLSFNTESFNIRQIPKIALALENANISPEQFESQMDEWMANFSGVGGANRIPVFNGKITAIDLLKGGRDMDYQKFLEFTASLTAAIYGYDLMESGLKFFSSATSLNENQDARQQFSKDRGLIDLLGAIENVFNKILLLTKWGDTYKFVFSGLNPQDREFEQKNRRDRVESVVMVDEVRAEMDLPPLPDKKGQVILNSVYMQNVQMLAQSQMQSSNGDGEGIQSDDGDEGGQAEDDDIDGITDDVLDEMGLQKAKLTIRARNLLL